MQRVMRCWNHIGEASAWLLNPFAQLAPLQQVQKCGAQDIKVTGFVFKPLPPRSRAHVSSFSHCTCDEVKGTKDRANLRLRNPEESCEGREMRKPLCERAAASAQGRQPYAE